MNNVKRRRMLARPVYADCMHIYASIRTVYVTAYIIFDFRVRARNNENQFAGTFSRVSNAENWINVLKILSNFWSFSTNKVATSRSKNDKMITELW